jgi:hypothetical protein
MSDWHPIARLLIFAGAGLIVLQRENVTLYIPIATMLIVSIVLSVIFTLVSRWLNNK